MWVRTFDIQRERETWNKYIFDSISYSGYVMQFFSLNKSTANPFIAQYLLTLTHY